MAALPRTLVELFDAEHRRDWPRVRELVHPDVVWTVVDASESQTNGAEAYVDRLRTAYETGGSRGFTVERVRVGADGLVATELRDEDGHLSLDVFALDESGLVVREWEFLLGPSPTPPRA